tara:strand:- start:1451 stop:1891 length:441 start_codon:yes stop_codon:yes gene_type:complete
MKVIFFCICINFLIYSCSPINKQHGYLLEDMLTSVEQVDQFSPGTTTENDVFGSLGSPSVKIEDINNIWIYLVSVKEKNVFEKDDIVFQSVARFEFDDSGILLSTNYFGKDDFTDIAFSKDKTRVITDNYGITDQIYESFTRSQGQ